MPLDFPGVPQLFKQSRSNDEGINKRNSPSRIFAVSGHEFKAADTTKELTYNSGACEVVTDEAALICSIFIPDNATITSIKVTGTAAVETYILRRLNIILSTEDNMTGNIAIGTATTAISFPVIDNTKYVYYVRTTTLDTGEIIDGLKIEYSE